MNTNIVKEINLLNINGTDTIDSVTLQIDKVEECGSVSFVTYRVVGSDGVLLKRIRNSYDTDYSSGETATDNALAYLSSLYQ